MATTTNYGWETPDDTDLVKDGAAAIRTLGSSVDTTTKALNPETTLGDLAYRSSTSNTNTRLAIGSTGQVLTVASGVPSWATPASGSTFAGCSLYLGSAITTSNDTYTTMTFNSENFDSDGYHSTVTNTSRITIPAGKGGKYLFYGNIGFTGNANGVRTATIYKNGTTYLFFNTKEPGATYEGSAEITFIADTVATDYFELLVRQDSGGNLNTSSGNQLTVFSCAYLGA